MLFSEVVLATVGLRFLVVHGVNLRQRLANLFFHGSFLVSSIGMLVQVIVHSIKNWIGILWVCRLCCLFIILHYVYLVFLV